MLHVDNLSLSFRGDGGHRPIFPSLTFQVSNGEILAIVGDSGAGKTSLLNAVAGFIRPLHAGRAGKGEQRARMDFLPGAGGEHGYLTGEVRIDGRPVSHLPPHRRSVGMLMQNFSIFEDRSILDNLTFGALVRGVSRTQRLDQARKSFHLLKLDIPAAKIDAFLASRAGRLSGGERQRVALVRLVNDHPPIWLLDEPYANLDALKREEISSDIRAMISDLTARNQVSALIVCHDLHETLLADKLLVLADDDRRPDWAYAQKNNGVFVLDRSRGGSSPPVQRWIDRLTRDKILV